MQSKVIISKFILALACLAGIFVIIKALQEFYWACPCDGPWFGRFTLNWAALFIAIILISISILSICFLEIWTPTTISSLEKKLIQQRVKIGRLLRFIGIIAIFIPSFIIFFTSFGTIFQGLYLRSWFLLLFAFIWGLCFTTDSNRLIQLGPFLIGILLVGCLQRTMGYLISVTNYPFSLFYSEGNRLYDYSVPFGRNRYLNPEILSIPLRISGRNILWGIIYLFPNTPIWLHRFWDALLWILPPLVVGFILIRQHNLVTNIKLLFILGCYLFISQGPIYAPLLIGAALVFAVGYQKRRWLLLIAVLIATYYVSISRFTWVVAPALWALIMLLDQIEFSGQFGSSKIIRAFGLVIILLLAGYIVTILTQPNLVNPFNVFNKSIFNQPLLWQRLLPNSTYKPGILLGLSLAAGPLVGLLLWTGKTWRWATHWIKRMTYILATLFFLAIGLVASIKIGGGSNLHNLDMFLITLLLLSALALLKMPGIQLTELPIWVKLLLILTILIPAMNSIRTGNPLSLPDQPYINQTLEYIQEKIDKRIDQGEILFIDQRQLLTFGYIQNVPLVEDYEKKRLMENAMANDEAYFNKFNSDLAKKRFSLIITNPIFQNIQDEDYRFDEENNTWVKWVAYPLMCYYAPVMTFDPVSVQLLVPRVYPLNCRFNWF